MKESKTQTKRLPEAQHESLCKLGYFHVDSGGQWAIPKDQTKDGLKQYQLLLRRGLVMRGDFNDRRIGYRMVDDGWDYLLEHQSSDFQEVSA